MTYDEIAKQAEQLNYRDKLRLRNVSMTLRHQGELI